MDTILHVKNNYGAHFEQLEKELKKVFSKDDCVAIKLHMGEKNNPFYLKPELVKPFVDMLIRIGAKPFLFDTCVCYRGPRSQVDSYLELAKKHGFCIESMGCPVVISNTGTPVQTQHLNAPIPKELLAAEGILVLSHVKGHECCGFGAAIKNLGMGGITSTGKRMIHNGGQPAIDKNLCTGCGLCVKNCPDNALSLSQGKSQWRGKCIGCSICYYVCPAKAIACTIAPFDMLLAEGAHASIQDKLKTKKLYFINFLIDIAAHCDCYQDPGPVLMSDIGILAGTNIAAIDKASMDIINKTAGKDFFLEIHHKSPLRQIEAMAALTKLPMDYELEELL